MDKYHRLEFIVEEIEQQFKDGVRRKIVKVLNDLGLGVISSNIGVVRYD